MKHKVANLEDALLDAAVAKAEGAVIEQEWIDVTTYEELSNGARHLVLGGPGRARGYSSEWDEGGPIIERERIASFNSKGVWFAGYEIGSIAEQYYDPESAPVLFEGSEASGPTLLVAAMRAYLSSRFGEEVELP